MKKKLILMPAILFGILGIVNWGCEKDEEDDYCQAFEEIIAIEPNCEIPTVCCPLDGGDCYYVNPDGPDYYCDASSASEDNKDGCNDAMDSYINEHCETAKMALADRDKLKVELSKFTRKLMLETREKSICN